MCDELDETEHTLITYHICDLEYLLPSHAHVRTDCDKKICEALRKLPLGMGGFRAPLYLFICVEGVVSIFGLEHTKFSGAQLKTYLNQVEVTQRSGIDVEVDSPFINTDTYKLEDLYHQSINEIEYEAIVYTFTDIRRVYKESCKGRQYENKAVAPSTVIWSDVHVPLVADYGEAISSISEVAGRIYEISPRARIMCLYMQYAQDPTPPPQNVLKLTSDADFWSTIDPIGHRGMFSSLVGFSYNITSDIEDLDLECKDHDSEESSDYGSVNVIGPDLQTISLYRGLVSSIDNHSRRYSIGDNDIRGALRRFDLYTECSADVSVEEMLERYANIDPDPRLYCIYGDGCESCGGVKWYHEACVDEEDKAGAMLIPGLTHALARGYILYRLRRPRHAPARTRIQEQDIYDDLQYSNVNFHALADLIDLKTPSTEQSARMRFVDGLNSMGGASEDRSSARLASVLDFQLDDLINSLTDLPEIERMCKDFPHLKEFLNDKSFLMDQLKYITNPALKEEFIRSTDRQLANLNGIPGSHNDLERFYYDMRNSSNSVSGPVPGGSHPKKINIDTRSGPRVDQILNPWDEQQQSNESYSEYGTDSYDSDTSLMSKPPHMGLSVEPECTFTDGGSSETKCQKYVDLRSDDSEMVCNHLEDHSDSVAAEYRQMLDQMHSSNASQTGVTAVIQQGISHGDIIYRKRLGSIYFTCSETDNELDDDESTDKSSQKTSQKRLSSSGDYLSFDDDCE